MHHIEEADASEARQDATPLRHAATFLINTTMQLSLKWHLQAENPTDRPGRVDARLLHVLSLQQTLRTCPCQPPEQS
jgi:hypothetical protein